MTCPIELSNFAPEDRLKVDTSKTLKNWMVKRLRPMGTTEII